ncbi:MAG TPA: PTS sugar transporter subunit IIA, partial [Opitutaceae bacterium]|nr:PTS sugar transporter subunit IIA [Opitutaceae bacterium]
MRLDKIIARSRLVELESNDLKGALDELLHVSVAKFPDLKPDALLKSLLQRESTMTTYLGNGVSLPHVRVKMSRPYVLAVGRSRAGIRHDGVSSDEHIHFIIMLIAGENARSYLQVLASLARLLKEPEFIDSLLIAPDLDSLYEKLIAGLGGIAARPVQAQQNRVNRLMLREAERVAKGASCGAMMVFGDTFVGGIEAGTLKPKLKTILVTRNLIEAGDDLDEFAETIQVRSFSKQRLAQLRSAMLVGLTRGVISFNDRICCIGGIAGSNQFDTLVVVDVEREFQTLLTGHAELLPEDVKPEVLERVIAIATELAVEGREGKPVGCLFVIGDIPKVEK